MSFLQEIDANFLADEAIEAFERQQREDQLTLEVLAWLRKGAEPKRDRPPWYEEELEQCYEDNINWLRDDWEA